MKTYTVSEIIEQLQKMPQDAIVVYQVPYESHIYGIDLVGEKSVVKLVETHYIYSGDCYEEDKNGNITGVRLL